MELSVYVDNSSGDEERKAAAILNRAEKVVSIDISFGGIVRFVKFLPDGTVRVEDIPQATGMDADQVSFICPPGRTDITIPPPQGDRTSRGYKTPDVIVDRK